MLAWCPARAGGAPAWSRPAPAAVPTPPCRGDADVRGDLADGHEPQRLHPVEVLGESGVDAEPDEFVQPGHHHPRQVFLEAEHVRRFRIAHVRESGALCRSARIRE